MAHCSLADWICLRLATHALVRDDSRALTKLGTAIANRMPMIRTTIMISINVKPRFNAFFNLVAPSYLSRWRMICVSRWNLPCLLDIFTCFYGNHTSFLWSRKHAMATVAIGTG